MRGFRVYAMLASQLYGIPIVTWISDRTIRKTHDGDTILVAHNEQTLNRTWLPDSIFALEIQGVRWYCSLEIDMGNQSLDVWAVKVKTIIEYRQRGLYQQRYKTTSQRNLIVTTSEERLTNLKRVAEEVGARSRFWFTTWDKINEHTIFGQPAWHIATKPIEERHAVKEVA